MAGRKKPKVLEVAPHQIGKPSPWDLKRAAMPPGKRISATGHVYYEYRANRSDLPADYPGAYPVQWMKLLHASATQVAQGIFGPKHTSLNTSMHMNILTHNTTNRGGAMETKYEIRTVKGTPITVVIVDDGSRIRWYADTPTFGRVTSSDFRVREHPKDKSIHYITGVSSKDGKPVYIAWKAGAFPDFEAALGQCATESIMREQRRTEARKKQLIREWWYRRIQNIDEDPWELKPGHVNAPHEVISEITKRIAERTGLLMAEAEDLWLETVGYYQKVKKDFEGLTPEQIIEKAVKVVEAKRSEEKRRKQLEAEKDAELLRQAKEKGQPIWIQIGGYDGDDWESVKLYGTPEIIRAHKQGAELGWVVVWKVYHPDGRIIYVHEPTG